MALPNKDQLFLLALCRLSEPLSNTCLLPYIFYLMRSVLTAGDDSAGRISQLSGLLVASFPLAQCATSMLWARFADSLGRRPAVVGALLASAVANLAFGFSRSFWALLLWRTIAGIANGNVGVMRTMTAEIVREKRFETKAFLLIPLVFNSGMVAGVALGGCLADPVRNLPWLFGPQGAFNVWGNPDGVQWALSYPYALPAMWNAGVLAMALLLSFLGLRETLAGKEGSTDIGIRYGRYLTHSLKRYMSRNSSNGYAPLALDDMDTRNPADEEAKPGPKRGPPSRGPPPSIWTREVIQALAAFCLLPLHNNSFMHIFPVYLSNPPADNADATIFAFNGGLGLQSPSIGLWLGLLGVCGILLQLFIYPRMQARIGTLGNFRVALFIFPATYALAPYLSLLPERGFFRWFCIGVVAWSQIMARTLAIPSTVILLTNSAPEKRVLGKIHGVGNMLSSLARAVGPAVGGWVFAWGIQGGMVGAVWWFYLFVIAASALAQSYRLRPS
jgi:MFS family permease